MSVVCCQLSGVRKLGVVNVTRGTSRGSLRLSGRSSKLKAESRVRKLGVRYQVSSIRYQVTDVRSRLKACLVVAQGKEARRNPGFKVERFPQRWPGIDFRRQVGFASKIEELKI